MLDLSTRMFTQDDHLIIGRTQDCTPIAERAKAMHNEGLHGSGEMKLAATIPSVMVEKYCNERGISFAEFMAEPAHIKRMCNDPDNKMFRVWPGRV